MLITVAKHLHLKRIFFKKKLLMLLLIFFCYNKEVLYKKENNKVDSVETGRIVIAHLLP